MDELTGSQLAEAAQWIKDRLGDRYSGPSLIRWINASVLCRRLNGMLLRKFHRWLDEQKADGVGVPPGADVAFMRAVWLGGEAQVEYKSLLDEFDTSDGLIGWLRGELDEEMRSCAATRFSPDET